MKNKQPLRFYCGTSNVVLPVPNKSYFPPEFRDKSRLSYYASLFNSVELNSSFYKIPQRRTVERWAGEVPAGFRFSFKLWKGITHAKELLFDPADVGKFMDSVNGIGTKKGCLLVQFPASIKVSAFRKVRNLLDQLHIAEQMDQWKLAVEFRDISWYDDTVYHMLEQYHAGVVIHDMAAAATPGIDQTAVFSYYRFHGPEKGYRGSYEDAVLEDYSLNIRYDLKAGREVFAYFNNTLGAAVDNTFMLHKLVKTSRI